MLEGNPQDESPEVMWGISVSSKRTAETPEWERSSDAGKKKLLVPPLFLLGGNQSRARRHFFPLRIWKKDGKHEEDLMLWSYKEICQAQGGFSCPPKSKQNHGKHEEDLMLWSYEEICQAQGGFSFPPKCKQNHGKHIEDLMLIQADFPPAASCFSWSMCRSGTRFDVLHHLSAQFALSVTLKTPCWEVLGMGDNYSVVNWALALQPLSAINPFFLTILYVICWLTLEAIINIWLWENEQIRHSLPSNCKPGDFFNIDF